MPQQLDWCPDCHAPIYLETVEGACSCQLGALKAIQANLRNQRQANVEAIRQGQAPALPDVNRAIREVVAARHSTQSLENILMAEARRVTGQTAPAQEPTTDRLEDFQAPVQGAQVRTAGLQPPGTIRTAGRPQPIQRVSLESLWGTPEVPQEALEDAWVAGMETEFQPGGPLEPDPNEIQFDDGLGIEFENNNDWAGSAPRFRVDRGTPVRERFHAEAPTYAAEGEVVAVGRQPMSRVQGMSIREVREAAQRMARESAQSVGLAREVVQTERQGPVTTRQATAQEAARARESGPSQTQQAAEKWTARPTVYDKLRRGILDDD